MVDDLRKERDALFATSLRCVANGNMVWWSAAAVGVTAVLMRETPNVAWAIMGVAALMTLAGQAAAFPPGLAGRLHRALLELAQETRKTEVITELDAIVDRHRLLVWLIGPAMLLGGPGMLCGLMLQRSELIVAGFVLLGAATGLLHKHGELEERQKALGEAL